MKLVTILIVLACLQSNLYGQQEKISRTKFVAGISAPELLHLGVTYRIANISQVGINAGLGLTWGGVWPCISLEHRLYFGKNEVKTNQKSWFCRQGSTFFPSALEMSSVILVRSLSLWPALRFEFYFS